MASKEPGGWKGRDADCAPSYQCACACGRRDDQSRSRSLTAQRLPFKCLPKRRFASNFSILRAYGLLVSDKNLHARQYNVPTSGRHSWPAASAHAAGLSPRSAIYSGDAPTRWAHQDGVACELHGRTCTLTRSHSASPWYGERISRPCELYRRASRPHCAGVARPPSETPGDCAWLSLDRGDHTLGPPCGSSLRCGENPHSPPACQSGAPVPLKPGAELGSSKP